MKKLLLILHIAFCILHFAFAQQYGWVYIGHNIPGDSLNHNLSDLHFINNNEGWINSNTHNEIYYTTDGGTTFATQSIESAIDAIHMSAANSGYTAADDGSIYSTTDGGTNWNFLAPTFVNLNDITFPRTGSTATGYACGDDGAIYSVTYPGADVMKSGVVSSLQSITFPTATEGWVCGQSVILHFVNGTWQGDQGYPTGTYNAIYFTDNLKGWAVGTKIIHTTDGQNWIAQTNPDPLGRTLVDIFLLNENEGWIVGNRGLILHTTNGGTTWTVEANGLTSALLTGVQFTSSTNGYVVGNNKTLFKYTQLTGIEEKPLAAFEVFPNLTRGHFKIQSKNGKDEYIRVDIVDCNGRFVANLFEGKLNANVMEFDVSHLPAGVYFCKISFSNSVIVKKIVKL